MREAKYKLMVARDFEAPRFLQLWHDVAAACKFGWFQSPGWVLPWWRINGVGRQAFVLALYDDTELICIAPWCVSNGMIYSMGDPLNDVNGFLVTKGQYSSLVTETVFAQAAKLLPLGFERLVLDCWPDELPAYGLGPFRINRQADVSSPVIEDLVSEEHYMGRLGKSRVQRMSQLRRKMERELPGATFEVASSADRAIYLALKMLELREQGLGPRGFLEDCEPSSRAGEFHDFVVELIRSDPALQNVVVAAIMYKGEVMVAGLYFLWNKTLMKYMQGWDLSLRRLSVGSLLDRHMVGFCCLNGIQSLALGRGAEQYKFRLGATNSTLYSYYAEIDH